MGTCMYLHNQASLFFVCFCTTHCTTWQWLTQILPLQLAIQLGYAYNQILSVLTNTQLHQIFEKSPGFDLRHLLQGSEKFVDNILNMADTDPSLVFAGVNHVHVHDNACLFIMVWCWICSIHILLALQGSIKSYPCSAWLEFVHQPTCTCICGQPAARDHLYSTLRCPTETWSDSWPRLWSESHQGSRLWFSSSNIFQSYFYKLLQIELF